MHYKLIIIMPPAENVEGSIEKIMEPYDECSNIPGKFAFYDWYQIGGRFSCNPIKKVSELDNESAYRVIFADNDYEPLFMLVSEFWNGLNYQKTDWSENINEAITEYEDFLNERERMIPENFPDWLAVTIDYHD